MLSPYRVLDLTDDRGEIAGMVLGDLGADVIKVEPVGGCGTRRQGPLLSDGPPTERSLVFCAYGRNKRSIQLGPDERDALCELVRTADFVLESSPPSTLAPYGLDFAALRRLNPRIVHVQLTPFGSDGPAAERPASDLTLAALGGPVSLQGRRERAPLRVSVPQVWRHAGAEAAVAALIAHARMRATGEAQQVDVSAQCAMTWTMLQAMEAYAIQGFDFERSGSQLQLGTLNLEIVWECADGHVVALGVGRMVQALVGWMIEEGVVEPSWAEEDWSTWDMRVLAGQELAHDRDEVSAAFARLFRRHRKQELMERALAGGATIAPVNTIPDLLDSAHLEARRFWQKSELPTGQAVRAPGVFARPGAVPLRIRRAAPRLDEHGAELRAELARRPRPSSDPPSPSGEPLPLAGLKVADFSWIGVGPISGRCLADHGATVVRVESESRADGLRAAAPHKDAVPGWNRSQFFGDFNTSKLGLSLDLKQPAALEIARRLVAWADVCIESFTPGTMERLGLGYAALRTLNPSLLMLSTCLMGQSGPAAQLAGYGYHAGALAGFYEVTGWPDGPPEGPWTAYTDTIAPRFVTATLLAAIDHRRRTGEGQHIDGAQLEMALHFLAPEILDYQASGHVASRLGNRARDAAPQGVYPCAGEDQWCAIAVETEAQWRALCTALGAPERATAPDLASHAKRLARHDELDAWIASWTREREPQHVMETLTAAGVPAGVVQRSQDLLRDPQYAHRNFYRYLEHPEMGRIPYAGHQFRIRGYDSGPRAPAPLLGQHSEEVMRDLLGMTDDETAAAVAAGALG